MTMNADELRKNPRPWMTDDAIDFIERNLRVTDEIIEYGGGWSSLWWAKRAAFTLTIEADHNWAAQLMHEMAVHPELMTRWALRFVASNWNPDASKPKQYWTANASHLSAETCATMASRYLWIDFEPDVFVIDGSVRPQNIATVDTYIRSHFRPRMIIVDNMESLSKYTIDRFSGFQQYDFPEYELEKIPKHQNGKWMTSVWLRA
jgi:hypothetical protein